MIRTGDRQGVWAAGAVIACGAAVWLAAPPAWFAARVAATAPARDAGRGLPSTQAAISPGDSVAMPSDDVAARFARSVPDDAQRTTEDDLAASRAELDADQLRPEALIAQEAGGRYDALDVDSRPAAPPAAPAR